MTGAALAALLGWLVLALVSLAAWRHPARTPRPALARTRVLVAVVAVSVAGTAAIAWGAGAAPALAAPWSWTAVGVGALAALLSGGAVTRCVLGLADESSRPGVRVVRSILRGGAWIGALERLGLYAALVAGWPAGMAAIVAVKAFARYPELRSGSETGAIERFIIGTFTSLGWAAVCAGVAVAFLR